MTHKDQTLRYMFWNVEKWDDAYDLVRIDRVAKIILDHKADIVTLCEVQDSNLEHQLAKRLSGYSIHLSCANNKRKFITAFKTPVSLSEQDSFISSTGWSRHAPLITLNDGSMPVAIMPVHLKSGTTTFSYNTRREHHAYLDQKATDLSANGTALLVIGDMNTMGCIENSGPQISAEDEIKSIQSSLGRFTYLLKNANATFKGVDKDAKYGTADLDHAIITNGHENLIQEFHSVNGYAKIRVGGWIDLDNDEDQQNWVRQHSDHSYLIVDIIRPA